MKKIARILLLAALALALALAGCGTAGDSSLPASSVPQEPAVSELDQNIADYEGRVAADPSAENYTALAGFYQQAGRVKKQRDALESCYRLHRDAASLEALQGIVVNAAEESPAVLEEARLLEQNLSMPEYQTEAAGMLISPDWHPTMMPKLKAGHRTYYLDGADGQSTLVVEVGYTEDGAPYTRAWRVAGETATCLLQEGSAIQLLATSIASGQYNGPFDSWLCVGETGTVYHDTGTFTNGVMTGAYTSDVSSMGGEADPFALFSTRTELEPVAYTGDFGTDGATTLEQPAGENDFVAYAYNGDKTNYLLLNLPAGEETHVFDSGFLGLAPYPEYTPYTPVPDPTPTGEVTVDLAQVQVRVNDGNVEWFDGATWHTMGSVAELEAQDPFLAAEQAAEQAAAQAAGTDEGAEEDNLSEIRDVPPASSSHPSPFAQRGTAQAQASSSSSASRGASSQAASSKPASSAAATGGGATTPQEQAPAPTQAPAPAPAPTQAPPPDPAPTEAPPPVQPPATGNDGEDIWSGDIL